jgi:uncharacterized protein YggE
MSCQNQDEKNQRIISVSGVGTVMAQPDMVKIYVYFKNVSKTTEEARVEVNKSVKDTLEILKQENIADSNIQTISLSYGIENEYKNGSFIYIGQKAEQTIIVTVDGIKTDTKKLSDILDKLILVDNITIRNISFDIIEKTELFKQSRELAFQKAFDKASQYAILSGKKIDGIKSITESRTRDAYISQSNILLSQSLEYDGEGGSGIPTGEQEITTQIAVEYIMSK